MKKILLVISSLNFGGAQRAFSNMSLAFPEKYQIDFLLNDTKNISYDYRGKIIDLGIKEASDRSDLFYQLKVFIKRYFKLRELKHSGQYAACISALSSANAVNVLTGNKDCKTIISIRNFMSKSVKDSASIKNKIEIWVLKRLSNYADHVVAVSESIRRDIIQNFGVSSQKAVTIYNGYNLNNIVTLAKEGLNEQENQWFASSKKIIVNAGRLEEQKGQEHLIRAFKYVREKYSDVRLLILGEGKLKTALQKLIKELELEDDIILCGFVKNPYRIIERSNLFVLSSLYEGFPNALAESICIGVPVVSTDCDSGAREILAPGTDLAKKVMHGFEKAEYGILCPVYETGRESGNAEEQDMAKAILYMLENEDAYAHYRIMCKKRAEQLSMNKMIEKWTGLIEK